MAQDRARLGYVDTWRFLAVGLVILSHVLLLRHVRLWGVDDGARDIGYLGVLIFFFVSGYVVGRVALAELSQTGRFSTRAFYVRRAFRILPPLALYLVTCLALSLSGLIALNAWDLVPAALFQCNAMLFDCGWHVSMLWSLAFEEHFYLLFPLIVAWSMTSRTQRGCTVLIWMVLALPPLLAPIPWIGRTGFILYYGLFAMGVAAARYPAWTGRISRPNVVFFAGLVVTFFPLALTGSELAGKYFKFAYVISVPAMVIATGHTRFFLARAFEWRISRYIGRASYSIYLWQQLFTSPETSTLPLVHQLFLIALGVVGVLALFEYMERPLNAYAHSVSEKLKSFGREDPRYPIASVAGIRNEDAVPRVPR